MLGEVVSVLQALYGEAARMSITRPIPGLCSAIVDAIRNEVPRPVDLPVLEGYSGLRWLLDYNECCPMGFLRAASCYLPGDRWGLPGFEDGAVEEFGVWWDEQSDAEAAVEAVWGDA